jgi:spore coat polysaccharide biosynthesis predicted glycosyltransferase SpsG
LDCVILIDIEGGEYNLLTDKVLNELKQTEVIIEIHVFNEQQELERIKLMKAVSNLFNLNIIRTSGRDFSEIDKDYQFTDTDRGLIISESRDRLGEWWHLSAKK